MDSLAEALIPNDCPFSDYKAIKTKGGGSRLYNSLHLVVSILFQRNVPCKILKFRGHFSNCSTVLLYTIVD